mgnify:CR=1 FL=1
MEEPIIWHHRKHALIKHLAEKKLVTEILCIRAQFLGIRLLSTEAQVSQCNVFMSPFWLILEQTISINSLMPIQAQIDLIYVLITTPIQPQIDQRLHISIKFDLEGLQHRDQNLHNFLLYILVKSRDQSDFLLGPSLSY